MDYRFNTRKNNSTIGRISKEYAEIRKKIATENKVSLVEADGIIAGVVKELDGKKKTRRFEIRF